MTNESGNELGNELGVVAAPHQLATEVGATVLRAGGNAFDAAVAVALAIGVTQPYHSGIGGGCNITYCTATGQLGHINARGPAPAALSRNHFLKPDGSPDHDLATVGALAVTIPSFVAGLHQLHRGRGRLAWADVCLAPQATAEQGFAADFMLARVYANEKTAAKVARYSGTTGLGQPIAKGATVIQPQMAATLAAIAADPRAPYTGSIARALVATVQRHGGVLTDADLATYQPAETPLHQITYRDWQIFAPGLPTIGSLQTLLALQSLQAQDLSQLDAGSPAHLHLVAETIRGTYALRAEMGSDAEAARIADAAYAAQLAAKLHPDRVHPTTFAPLPNDSCTSHFCVADGDGNVVAQTQTIRSHFGCGIIDPATGIVLNDSVGDFSLQPGQITTQGIRYHGSYNLVAPGAEPASSQSPLIARHEGSGDLLAAGAAGGPRIVSATVQGVINQIDFEMTPEQATALPRVHSHGPITDVEPTSAATEALAALGHQVEALTPLGIMQTIRRRAGRWQGGADPRSPGSAVVVTRV